MNSPEQSRHPSHQNTPSVPTSSPPAASASAVKPPDPYVFENQSLRWIRMAVIAAGALILAVMLLRFVEATGHSIALLFVAIVIGEALAPVVTRLERFMSRGLAVGLLFLSLIGMFVGLGIWLAPQITGQTTALIDSLPAYADRVSVWLDDLPYSANGDTWAAIESNIGNFTLALVSVPMAILTSVAQVFIVSFMAGYWIVSRRAVREFLESLVPTYEQDGMRKLLQELSQTVGGYIRGTGLGALTIGAIVFIGLSVMGVNYPLVLAIFAAFGELIPILGPNLAAIPAIIIAFLDSWQLAVGVVVFYVVLQQLESLLLVPALMNNQANIPPLIVIVSVSFGGAIAGILGAIIAIPAAGALRVIVLRVIAPAIRRWTGADAEPLPES